MHSWLHRRVQALTSFLNAFWSSSYPDSALYACRYVCTEVAQDLGQAIEHPSSSSCTAQSCFTHSASLCCFPAVTRRVGQAGREFVSLLHSTLLVCWPSPGNCWLPAELGEHLCLCLDTLLVAGQSHFLADRHKLELGGLLGGSECGGARRRCEAAPPGYYLLSVQLLDEKLLAAWPVAR